MSHYVIDGKDFTSTTFRFGDRMERTRGRSISSGYSEALDESEEERIDFLLLMAKDHGFYQANGFQLATNTCQWLMISEHHALGIAHRRVKSSLMVKALGKKEWRPGLVDFLGHVF